MTVTQPAGTQWAVTNWAGNIRFGARAFHEPRTVEELQRLVAASDAIRVLGSGHSFSPIADTHGDLVSLGQLNRRLDIDRDAHTATVSAGLRYGDVVTALDDAGYALPNTGSLPHIAIAGACSTGTHGSGTRLLATSVSAIELVLADGSLATVRRGDDGFDGSVVALGALGVVTSLTLDLVPTFDVAQTVYEDLPAAALETHLLEILDSAYSVSIFTTWGETVDMVWCKRRIGDPPGLDVTELGATPATTARHPIPSLSGETCTEQLGIPGRWYARLPHFRLEFTPSAGDELQSEYLVPRASAIDAVRAVAALRQQLAPVLMVSEIRTAYADELWLSPAYDRDVVGLHFTWRPDTAAVLPVLERLEEALAPYDPRPHWGKVFTTDPKVVRAAYPRLPDFEELWQSYDPQRAFGNEFVDRYVG